MAIVPYPSWRYHATLPSKIVYSPEEDADLAAGWVQSPADLAAGPPVPAAGDDGTPIDVRATELYATKATEVIVKVADATDAAILTDTRMLEVANPNARGGRRTILAAIDARLEALARDSSPVPEPQ